MVIGTAQLGNIYGVTNQVGKADRATVFEILNFAWEHGIRHFDTAPDYGWSENLLGEFIFAHGIGSDIRISTKVPAITDRHNFDLEINQSIHRSLEKLGSGIDVLFLHDPRDAALLTGDWPFFENLVSTGQIGRVGLSIYDKQEIEQVPPRISTHLAYQFPVNLVNPQPELLGMDMAECYVRSIFLQGVLAEPTFIHRWAPESVKVFHRRYHNQLRIFGVDPVELAVSFVYSLGKVDYLIIGFDSISQLKKICDLRLVPSDLQEKILKNLPMVDHLITDPRNWQITPS